jgi:hypothetical protein
MKSHNMWPFVSDIINIIFSYCSRYQYFCILHRRFMWVCIFISPEHLRLDSSHHMVTISHFEESLIYFWQWPNCFTIPPTVVADFKISVSTINCCLLKNYFYFLLLYWGALWHLQKFLQCIRAEFTPSTILLHPLHFPVFFAVS